MNTNLYYVESLIDNLPLTEEQASELWDYADCLIHDEGIVGNALEILLEEYVEEEFDITISW